MIQIRKILVPTDFSPPALTALAYAKTLAAEFGSRLYLLHVIATPDVPWGAEGATYSWPTLLADIEKDVRAQFQHLIPPDDPLANQVTMETMIGLPVDGILDYTETHQIDLVVMGTHGRGMVGHLLLGSVAERVVRRSAVPVLTLHGTPSHSGVTEPVADRESLQLLSVPS